MARKPKKITISSLKKKAPKIPPLTCISIDNVISKLEKIVDKKKTLDKKQLKDLTKRLEKLRFVFLSIIILSQLFLFNK